MTVVAFLKRVVLFILHVAALAAIYVVMRPVFPVSVIPRPVSALLLSHGSLHQRLRTYRRDQIVCCRHHPWLRRELLLSLLSTGAKHRSRASPHHPCSFL